MKRKNKRKIRRFWGILFTIYGGVFTLGSFITAFLIQPLVSHIATSLQPQVPIPVQFGLTVFWFIVLVTLYFVSKVLFYIYLKSVAPEINYFEEVDFGKPDKSTILKAVDCILNTEKIAHPYAFCLHAAPKCKEVEIIKSRLEKTGFVMVSGGPGEGKSMAAYHTAYKFQNEARYRVYALQAERLENKTGKEVLDEVLFQLDTLKGKRKLIIVDDAHKLAIKQDLNGIMSKEVEEGHSKYIWIETKFYEEKQDEVQPDKYIRINFQDFFGDLLKNFYQSQDPILQEGLKGRIKRLNDAIGRVNKKKILDVWWFAFSTSGGEEKIAEKVAELSDTELLVLFFISVYTVLSGEAELHRNYVLSKISDLKFGWLIDNLKKSSVGDIITSLQGRQLIKIYYKSKNDKGYIASLHYNFAKATIQVSLSRKHLAEDLLASVKALLTDEYQKCVYIWVFHRDIGAYATKFDHENKEWLINFINNLLLEWLKCYFLLLRDIKNIAEDIYDEIIGNIDIHGIAEKISSAEVGQFQQLAYLLNAMGDRRDELIEKLDLAQLGTQANNAKIEQFVQIANLLVTLGDSKNKLIEKMDLKMLTKTSSDAKVEQFENLAQLLRELEEYRDVLIDELDFEKLAKAANSAEINEFEQIAQLLKELSLRKSHLSLLLDHDTLVRKANQAGLYDIMGLTMFMAGLEEEDRSKYIREIDWSSICLKCPIYVPLLSPLGASLENLWKQAESLSNRANVEKVTQHLRAYANEIKQEIAKANPRQYSGVAKFLWNCNQVDPDLAKEIAIGTRSKLTETFSVRPTEYQGAGRLINALHDIDPALSATFIKNNRVRGRIQVTV